MPKTETSGGPAGDPTVDAGELEAHEDSAREGRDKGKRPCRRGPRRKTLQGGVRHDTE